MADKFDFASELDALITKGKAEGENLDDMVAELQGAADGLETEAQEADAQDEQEDETEED